MQSKGSVESSGNALGAVVMQDFEVHPATGKAEHNKDPSFGMGENRSKYVCLTVGKRRLNSLKDIGTSASNAVKCPLFSLMHPGQDFFRFVIILRIPGMKKLD